MCYCYFCSKNTAGEKVFGAGFGEKGITVVEQGKMYGNEWCEL